MIRPLPEGEHVAQHSAQDVQIAENAPSGNRRLHLNEQIARENVSSGMPYESLIAGYIGVSRKLDSSQETVRAAFKELGQLRNALLRWCTAFPAEIDDNDRELISDELEAIFEEEDEL